MVLTEKGELIPMGASVSNQVEKVKSSKDVSDKNKELILGFLKKCKAEGLKDRRICKLMWIMRTLGEWADFDFDKATREDIEDLVVKINESGLKEWSQSDYKKVLKKFFKVMLSEDGYEAPKLVKWIKVKVDDRYQEKERLQNLLKPEHIDKLVEKAPNTMYKCLVKFLFESGSRISEIVGDSLYPQSGIKIKDITWDGDMVDILICGKTGSRTISIYDSVPLFTAWYQQHPCRKRGNAYFFTSNSSGKRLSYQTVSQTLKRIKKKAGVDVSVSPHCFRRASLTFFGDYLTSSQLSQKYGLVPGSSVVRHYEYRSPKQLKQAIRRMHGLTNPEDDGNQTKPKPCPRCHQLMDSGATQCLLCGFVLSASDRINRRKKQAVSTFIIRKIFDENPSLKSQVDKLSKKFEHEINELMEKV